MQMPTTNEFRQALDEYRRKWPGDGYVGSTHRFVTTYDQFKRFYQGGQVVDVGSWPGDFVLTLASLKIPVTAIDKSVGRSTNKTQDPTTGAYVLGDGVSFLEKCRHYGAPAYECNVEQDRLPFDDHSVDFITATEILEHLRVGLLHALDELRRVLARDGRLLITTPNLLSARNRVSFLFGRADYDTLDLPFDALAAEAYVGHSGHFRVFSMAELIDLLERSGFRIIESTYRHLRFQNGAALPKSLYGLRVKACDVLGAHIRPFANTLFVVAQPK